jgi:hypothetical protein
MPKDMTYAILTLPDSSHQIWDLVVQKPETVRKSLDGTLCVLKWRGELPSGTLPADATTYNHAEVLQVLSGPEWTPPIPEEPEAEVE